jgi:hypothetical protein
LRWVAILGKLLSIWRIEKYVAYIVISTVVVVLAWNWKTPARINITHCVRGAVFIIETPWQAHTQPCKRIILDTYIVFGTAIGVDFTRFQTVLPLIKFDAV